MSEREQIDRELTAKSVGDALWLAQFSAERLGWCDLSERIADLWAASRARQREIENSV